MNKLHFLVIVFILFSTVLFPAVEIIEETKSKFSFHYEIDDIKFIEDATGEYPEIYNGIYPEEQGYFKLPFVKFRLVIPSNENYSLNVAYRDRKTYYKNKIAVVQELVPKNDFAVYKKRLHGKNYNQNIYETEISSFRGYKVLNLYLYPFNYNEAQNELTYVKDFDISVTYNEYPGKPFRKLNNAFYSDLLNFETASGFRDVKEKKDYNSPFSINSEWYKIEIDETGMYEVDFDNLNNFPILSINNLRLFTFSERGFDYNIPEVIPDIKEVSYYVIDKNQNSLFDSGDKLVFYALHVNYWQDTSFFVDYFDKYAYYWLTWTEDQEGLLMSGIDGSPNTNPYEFDSILRKDHYEEDKYNFEEHSLNWYWDIISNHQNKEYLFNTKNPDLDKKGQIALRLKGKNSTDNEASFGFNGVPQDTVTWYGSSTTTYFNNELDLNNGDNILKISDVKENGTSYFYVDYFDVSYFSEFKAENSYFEFQGYYESEGEYTFSVSNITDQNSYVFQVNSFDETFYITNSEISDNTLSFRADVFSGSKIFILNEEKFKSPLEISKYNTENLREVSEIPDYIIIYHNDFYDFAQDLKSYREDNIQFIENPTIKAVSINSIYNEFSGGMKSPVSIRNYLKFLYDTALANGVEPPIYAVLVGDGNWDYKNNYNYTNPNFYIPPVEFSSNIGDDWYVILDRTGDLNDIDMSIGRFPASNPEEADNMFYNITQFENWENRGIWRNTCLMVADDIYNRDNETDNPDFPNTVTSPEYFHTQDSETMANYYIPESVNIEKTYLQEFSFDSDQTYKSKAKEAFIKQVNKGVLAVNFMGHGKQDQIAHENLLNSTTDVPKFNNDIKPIMSIFSCEVGQFDNPSIECLPEVFMKYRDKGFTAFLASNKKASAPGNDNLGRQYLRYFFTEEEYQTFGIAVMTAKNALKSKPQKAYYILFGDPALNIRRINDISAEFTEFQSDTLQIYQKVSLDLISNRISEGEVFLRFRDSGYYGTLKPESSSSAYEYYIPGDIIFDGKYSITDNEAELDFPIPYSAAQGDYSSFYGIALDNQLISLEYLKGSSIKLWGEDPDAEPDDSGPSITGLIGGMSITDGMLVTENFSITAEIEDESGISQNKIYIQLDDNEKIDISLLFDYYPNSYTKGSLEYKFDSISDGEHTIKIEAYDIFNNKSEKSYRIEKREQYSLIITNVYHYPNPFKENEPKYFTFWLNNTADIEIAVFTITGKEIRNFKTSGQIGFNRVEWNGKDADGDDLANGVYFFKVIGKKEDLLTGEVQKNSMIGKILKINE